MKNNLYQRCAVLAGIGGGSCLMLLLIGFPESAASGVRDSLTLCGELLIPSLFPTMLAAAILLQCGAVQRWGRFFDPLTQRLWKLPGCSGAVFILSMVGGYPIGSRCVRHLLDAGAITPAQGQRMLRFCVGAGPGFVITAVGCGLFHSAELGFLLWGCQILSGLLLPLLGRRTADTPATPKTSFRTESGPVLTAAVRDAADGMFSLCASVLAFGGIQSLLRTLLGRFTGAADALNILLEVTSGVQTARAYGSPALAAFVLGWGGLCVHMQIAAVSGLHIRSFALYRMLHGGLAALLTHLLFPLLPASDDLLATAVTPIPAATAVNTPFSLTLLALVGVFLLLLPDLHEKKIKN